MGHIIAVSNQKGGVGKTTTAVNLAACLGACGYRTLLVDMDPQANATSACGLDFNNLESNIYDSLIEGTPLPIYDLDQECRNLSVVPSSMDLAGAEFELMDQKGREFVLKGVLAQVSGQYDFILIDSPPSLGLLTLNILVASDWVLVPVQAEYLALEGLSHIIRTIQRVKGKFNESLDLLGIVATLYDGRTNLANQVLAELKRAFPDKVFQTPVSRSIRLSEAPSFGKPIIYRHSSGAQNYYYLSQEVLDACQKASVGPRT